MRNIILDTGAFVALLDKSENNHERCVNFFRYFKGTLLTTESVLTETIYLFSASIKSQKACIEFILKDGAKLIPQSSNSLSRAIVLIENYKDIPMDFADATLVTLAEETGINEIFTLDIKGFNIFKIRGKRSFKLLTE